MADASKFKLCYRFGLTLEQAGARAGQHAAYMTGKQAREYARMQPGRGYVWLFNSRMRHWAIVANYDDGAVWNGQAQCVPAKPDPGNDWRDSAMAGA